MKKVVVCLIRHPENPELVLYFQRRDNKLWTNVGGHCEEGEDVHQSALRELEEEAGVHRDKVRSCKLVADEIYTEPNPIHVYLFEVEFHELPKFNPHNDVDSEPVAGTMTWLNPLTTEKPLHVPKQRNIIINYLGGLDKSELQKTPKLLATGRDIQDGFDVLRNYENPDEDEDFNNELVDHYNEHATKPARHVSPEEVKNYIGADWGREVNPKYLNNPIIVGVHGDNHFILDGNHRAIEHLRRGSKKIPVIKVPLPFAQGIYDAEDVAPLHTLLNIRKSELQKGIKQKLFPVKTDKPVGSGYRFKAPAREKEQAWQYSSNKNPVARDEIAQQSPDERARGLLTLQGKTKHRIGPSGEREYLLHRGHSLEEKFGESHKNKVSSWTPLKEIAQDGATRHEGKVTSAWFSESDIKNLLFQTPGAFTKESHYKDNKRVGDRLYPEFSYEKEVLIRPSHTGRLATPEELRPTEDEFANERYKRRAIALQNKDNPLEANKLTFQREKDTRTLHDKIKEIYGNSFDKPQKLAASELPQNDSVEILDPNEDPWDIAKEKRHNPSEHSEVTDFEDEDWIYDLDDPTQFIEYYNIKNKRLRKSEDLIKKIITKPKNKVEDEILAHLGDVDPSKVDKKLGEQPQTTTGGLFRAYKHTPHSPSSLYLKYLVHRIENKDAYKNASPEGKDQLDSDFLKLHQKGKAAEKNGHITVNDLRAYTGTYGRKLIPQLINIQKRIHKQIPKEVITNIGGVPHVALTRGLDTDQPTQDHALASYADVADTGFGKHMHHRFVPLKNIWFSYDLGPDKATSNKYGNENEWLVSPHANLPAKKEDVGFIAPRNYHSAKPFSIKDLDPAHLARFHPSILTPEVQDKLASSTDSSVLGSLAEHHNIHPRVQRKLANHPSGVIRAKLAQSKHLHPETFNTLLNYSPETEEVVQNYLATNESLPDNLHSVLANSKHHIVKRNLARHPNLHPEAQKILAQAHKNTGQEQATGFVLANHPNLHPEAQMILANKKDPFINRHLAGHIGLIPELQQKLANSKEKQTHERLSQRIHLDPSLKDWHIKKFGTIHPSHVNLPNKPTKKVKKSELVKMSRPKITFPKLGTDPRPDQQVQPIESGRQKEIFGRKIAQIKHRDQMVPFRGYDQNFNLVADEMRPLNQQASRDKAANYIKNRFSRNVLGVNYETKEGPKAGALVGKERSKHEAGDDEYNTKLQQHKENRRKVIKDYNDAIDVWYRKAMELSQGAQTPEGRLKFVLHAAQKPQKPKMPRAPSKKRKESTELPLEARIQRGRDVDSTIDHEAFHHTMDQIEKLHGPIKSKLVVDKLVQQFDPETFRKMGDFISSVYSYNPKSSSFKEEILAQARDILVNPRKRELFQKFAGDSSKQHIQNLKQGHQKAYQIAQRMTHEDITQKSELEKGARGDWQKEGYKIEHQLSPLGNHHVSAFDKAGRKVGSVTFRNRPEGLVADSLHVHTDHRRKGIASSMYALAEQKSGIKAIRPLNYEQSDDAQALWDQPDRSFGKDELEKASNAWQNEGYEIGIEQEDSPIHQGPKIYAKKDGKFVAFSRMHDHDTHLEPFDTYVSNEHRRKGLATAMYQHAEKALKTKIKPSKSQTSEGKALWSQPNRPFGKAELEKAITPEEFAQQKYKIKPITTAKGHLHGLKLFHGNKVIGHVHYDPSPNKEGYHRIVNANIEPEHRGKGLYQHMINHAHNIVKQKGSRGVMSEGYQRSTDATRAWKKIATDKKDTGYPVIQGVKQSDGSYKDQKVHKPIIDYYFGKDETFKPEQILDHWNTYNPTGTLPDHAPKTVNKFKQYALQEINPDLVNVTPETDEVDMDWVEEYGKMSTEPPPVIVHPTEDGRYRIVDGKHRTLMARNKKIPLRAFVGKTDMNLNKSGPDEPQDPILKIKNRQHLNDILQHGDFVMITGHSHEVDPQQSEANHRQLMQDIFSKGYKLTPTVGVWNGIREPSYMVHNMSPQDATELARKYNQYAHLQSSKGVHEDVSHRPEYKPLSAGHGHEVAEDFNDNYSYIQTDDGQGHKFRLNLGNLP